MCCLFGVIDNYGKIPYKMKKAIVKSISLSAMDRGTDATGISFLNGKNLIIQKDNKSANKFIFKLKKHTNNIIGHTRLTTQGDNDKNYNLHPFSGETENAIFSLAHNGCISNYYSLMKSENLEKSKIETDSYIAVKLLEKENVLSLDSISRVCEKLNGTYCFSILDNENKVYLVKGNNPLCILYFPLFDCYIYASTKAILINGIKNFDLGDYEEIEINQYEIISIDGYNEIDRYEIPHQKTDWNKWENWCFPGEDENDYFPWKNNDVNIIYSLASSMGIREKYIDNLVCNGYSLDEIETLLYDMDGWGK